MNDKQVIKDALRELLQEEFGEQPDESSEFGFIEGGGNTTYAFLNRQEFDHGHLLNEDGEPTPLPSDRVRGYLEDVSHFTRSTDFGDSEKLLVTLNAQDRGRIQLEMGFFTNTAKALLPALAEVNPELPITVIMDPSDGETAREKKVLFVTVLQDNNSVQADWPSGEQDLIGYYDIVREQVLGLEREESRPQPRRSEQPQNGNNAPQRSQPGQQPAPGQPSAPSRSQPAGDPNAGNQQSGNQQNGGQQGGGQQNGGGDPTPSGPPQPSSPPGQAGGPQPQH